MISVPPEVGAVLDALRGAGYEAYPVGGCVRDSLLGLTPGDWDITTSARPDEVIALFGEENTIPTGLKHGTVTVRSGGGHALPAHNAPAQIPIAHGSNNAPFFASRFLAYYPRLYVQTADNPLFSIYFRIGTMYFTRPVGGAAIGRRGMHSKKKGRRKSATLVCVVRRRA